MVLAPNQEKGVARKEVKQQKDHLTRVSRHGALNRRQGAWNPAPRATHQLGVLVSTICGLGAAPPQLRNVL